MTRKTDVYAFGVVLFELLSGKLAVDMDRHIEEEQGSLARWAQQYVKEKRFDQMVDSNITGTIAPKCLRGFAEIANRCLIRDFEKRPSMTQVVAKLQDLLELQEKCDNSAYLPGTSGFTWMIRMYRAARVAQVSQRAMRESIARDIKIYKYDKLKRAIRNFKNDTRLGVGSYEKQWIDNTGCSLCMDDTGLPILVKILDSHILSDLKMLKEFRHPNLVKVIGYYKGETNLLVSEFVHNRNFEDLLHSGLLPLAAKVKVAVGIARGIVYLCNTTNNVGKVSYFSRYSELWDWDKTICTFELNKYKILLDEDFTAKLLEYDITKLVEDYDYDYDKRFMQYHITGLVDGDYVPGLSSLEVDIPLQTKIFSGFRSVFTEVLTGRNFSLEEFHKINH
ncbi:probable receptor-like protein kinase isoform X1, partial [Tanacetum coccineum]